MFEEAVEYKNQLYKELARVGKGIGNDKRLEILELLSQSPKSVEKIAQETGSSIANTSRHLQILKDSRLVKTKKDGNHVIYSLRSSKVNDLIHLLIVVGEEELSEMRSIEEKADWGIKTVSLEKAQQYRDSLWLDVRPEDEYESGHIKSAINIPLTELQRHLTELPKEKPIIVYCRGRLCANSNLATKILNQNGYDAFSLNCSYYEWQQKVK
ncbi:ArsR family transcriptional regulator [Limosilactobacillus reuteri]|jgi:DNA-binding transcriptional ArsR family regulator/rhodanese-related sulfurtransferase|uniref:ArsR family transcriptional regulator n=1 Tax=Limosilactobacillus reuteri TaxID=1598 RepID=A0A256SNG2_LIMRT|nr:metalloregulator ArsR/SmtB family transcription factor [Limosilactobacillus reuteri]MCR1863958.1 metalloregulator ArsR/SmtB family transcription factor [Limosilactobacillus reuteri]MCR1893732.1 metalloregulator ArsR/SmtB family transcription factor [Limosilactobacillus reuteri]MRG63571.1 metalloregulator ArsR/SmtB family transcription factor [Limosilactobacillus reuteri]OYS47153.1 ArsR family transcriptional regulator [Limosilactobacillus reuteri]OYS48604.1 ArsR family transcriptional regul